MFKFDWRIVWAVAKKEFKGYFAVPDGYVVLTVFLVLSGLYGFMIGEFLPSDDATLAGFLDGHRWVYLILIPALGMQMWSEERRAGTLELLFSLPVREWETVAGKFAAGLGVVALALLLTFPTVITVASLGSPDYGMMFSGYWGSLMLGCAYLGVTSLASSLTRNAVVSFVLGAAGCLLLNLCGLQNFTDLFTGILEPLGRFLSELGIRTHYQAFLRGIPDTRDLYYFLSVTLFGLLGTVSVLHLRRAAKRKNGFDSMSGLVIAGLILLFLGIIQGRVHTRFDLTEGALFSLSEVTKKTVRELPAQTDVRFYVSRETVSKWSSMQAYAKRLEALLDAYASISPEKLRVEKLNVTPRSMAEASARIDAVKSLQVEGIGEVWFGISVTSKDKRVCLPELTPLTEARLEYELTTALRKVTRTRQRRISILSPLPVNGILREGSASGSLPPWEFLRRVRQTDTVNVLPFNVKTIDRANTDVLILIDPSGFSPAALYAVDQYLMQGGNVIVFADPNCYYAAMAPHRLGIDLPPETLSSDLQQMMNRWGVHFASEVVAADMTLARVDPKTNLRMPCILEPSAGAGNFNTRHPVTQNLRHLTLWFSGFEESAPDTGIKVFPLVTSSEDVAVASKYIAHKHEDVLLRFKPDRKPKTLAAIYEGAFKSAYGTSAPAQFMPPRGGHRSGAAKGAKLAVVGDADMLFDSFSLDFTENPFDAREKIALSINDNLAFGLNLIDFMSGQPEMTALRGERNLRRPFTRLHAMKSKIEQSVIRSEKELISGIYQGEERLRQLRENPAVSPESLEQEQKRFDALLEQLSDLNRFRNQLASVENELIFWNIAAIPILVVLAGIATLWRLNRRRTAQ